MGQVVGQGLAPFGYDFVKKTPDSPATLDSYVEDH
jgi:hypothetical protein